MFKQKGFTKGELSGVLFWVLIVIGYITNIVRLVWSAQDTGLNDVTLMKILQIIGIFVPPLGTLLGYIPF